MPLPDPTDSDDRPRPEPAARGCLVRIFSHSSLTFANFPDATSLLDRTRSELLRLEPRVDWRCEGELLYVNATMAGRVEQRSAAEPADVVLLRVAEMHFMQDYVVYRIRRRWPRLYGKAVRISAFLNALAGGGPRGSPRPRGWLFRAPRWLAARTIGVAPEIDVEDAAAYTRAALDVVLRAENAHVVFAASSQSMPFDLSAAEAARRRERFMSQMRRYCRDHAVLILDPARLATGLGEGLGLGPDRWHEDVASRDLQARMYASAVVQALAGRTGEVEL